MLLTLLFPNQVSDNNVSVAIVHLIVVSKNVWAVAVTENMVIYEEDDPRLWIGDPLDVGNVLKDRHLQTLVGRAEFDVSHANPFCVHRTIAGVRVGSRYRRSVPSAKMMPVRVKFLILIMFRERWLPAPVSIPVTKNQM